MLSGQSSFTKRCWHQAAAPLLIVALLSLPFAPPAEAGAGVLFGPITVGNLKIAITNPHIGHAGPKVGRTLHINYLMWMKAGSGFRTVANYHISAYARPNKLCVYVWESKSDSTIYDSCSDDFNRAARQAMEAIRRFTMKHIEYGNWLVRLAIWSLAAALIIDFILPLDWIPLPPAEAPPGGSADLHEIHAPPLEGSFLSAGD